MYLDPIIKPAMVQLVGERMAAKARNIVMESAKARMPTKFYTQPSEPAATTQASSSATSSVVPFDLNASLAALGQVHQATAEQSQACPLPPLPTIKQP